MERKLRFAIAVGIAVTAGSVMAQNQNIQVVVHGDVVNFRGQAPIMSDGRVLVPLRGVLEKMGARVMWDPSTQTVSAFRDQTDVELHIGQNTASVNHHPVDLDVPAQIVNGSTMVPLRFVGEALGEHVHWDDRTSTVDIERGQGDYNIPRNDHGHDHPVVVTPPPPVAPQFIVYPADTVVPVSLDTILDSNDNRKGDQFTATVFNDPDFPAGTKVNGDVADVKPQEGNEPGVLELEFTQIQYPDGRTTPITGRLIGLDDKSVDHRHNTIVAKKVETNNRVAFTGYGAGAGLLIGLATHKPVRDTAIGGLLGLLAGSVDTSHPTNIHLRPGTQFGVRLMSPTHVFRRR